MTSRDAQRTRAAILEAARHRFGSDGYEGATLRAIAGDAGVDAALVSRYFGGKEGLFAEAAELHVTLPDLDGVEPADLAAIVLPTFVDVWENDPTFVALLRTSAVNEVAATALRTVFADQVGPVLRRITPDHGDERAGLWGSFVLGLAFSRYILRAEPIASMSTDELASWLAPVMASILTGPPSAAEPRR